MTFRVKIDGRNGGVGPRALRLEFDRASLSTLRPTSPFGRNNNSEIT